MKKSYDTLSEAVSDLQGRGYTQDFNLRNDCIECRSLDLKLSPESFEIDEMYRFEGFTNPADSSIAFAISSGDNSIKGILVDAYGAYAEPLTQEMIQKLRYKP